MFIPKHFSETRVDVIHQLIRAYPLSTLVTLSSGGLNANHIPLHLAEESGSLGILRGHVARANPIWKDIIDDVEVLAIFHGPSAYITPSWYPTKQETGKAVPTWNYVVAHAYGKLRVIDEPGWLRSQLDMLTSHTEAGFSEPWKVADAPADYTEKLIKGIVGIEIVISRLEGMWKTSQNQPEKNQAGVYQGLRLSDKPDSLEMAAMIEKNNTR